MFPIPIRNTYQRSLSPSPRDPERSNFRLISSLARLRLAHKTKLLFLDREPAFGGELQDRYLSSCQPRWFLSLSLSLSLTLSLCQKAASGVLAPFLLVLFLLLLTYNEVIYMLLGG